MKPFKVLFICTDNYTRSITGEFCLKDFLKKNNINDVYVSSAGTNASSDTSTFSDTHFTVMQEHGIDTSTWKRTQLTDTLLRENDLVIGMAQEHYDSIAEKFGFSVKLYNELINGEKTSIIVCSPDSKDAVERQIRDMTNYIFNTTPILYERIKELQKRK